MLCMNASGVRYRESAWAYSFHSCPKRSWFPAIVKTL